MATNDPLSRAFAALADPTRRAILERLASGEAGVVELAEASPLTQPAITKHLKVLEKARLITKSREAQWRPCKLNAVAFKDAADWMEQYRAFWEESFDRLEAYLKTVTSKQTVTSRQTGKGKNYGRKK